MTPRTEIERLHKIIAELERTIEAQKEIVQTYAKMYLDIHVESNKAADRWLPIETAPRDGMEILLWKPNRTDRYWNCVQASWFEGQFYASAMEDIIDYEDGIKGATHWMPLPAPPQNDKEKNNEDQI